MPDFPFKVFGTEEHELLGRTAMLDKMANALLKESPNHLQVVGPRLAGKTVLLRELCKRIRQSGSQYVTVVHWDLGHLTPTSDETFMQRFATELGEALHSESPEYETHLKGEGNNYGGIVEVLDLLEADRKRVLVVLDGFDAPLSNESLTRNLWDQLRDLAHRSSLRLVTSSRKTLRELIRDPRARTSDFWGIFDPSPIRVGCFDDNDLAEILGKLQDVTFPPDALEELWKATNGAPVMLLEALNSVAASHPGQTVSSTDVKAACADAYQRLFDRLDAQWSDCRPGAQDLFRRVSDEGTVPAAGLPKTDLRALVDRGFVREGDGVLDRPSALLAMYLADQPNEGNAIARLFGREVDFIRHFRAAMERRLSQIPTFDDDLLQYLEAACRDFPEHPGRFLTHVRGIVNRVFDLIWKAEAPDLQIPEAWFTEWQFKGERVPFDKWKSEFPIEDGRVHLLKVITGTQRSRQLTRFVTKATYVLVNAAHEFGNLGQHMRDTSPDPCFAYAGLNICIELASSLARDLQPKETT